MNRTKGLPLLVLLGLLSIFFSIPRMEIEIVKGSLALNIEERCLAFAEAGPIISIPTSASGVPGQSGISVPINVSSAGGIAGADMTLTFNPGILSATDVQLSDLTSGFSTAKNITPGQVILSIARATAIASGSGALVNVIFDVSPVASPGATTPLNLANISLFDENASPIAYTKENGLFSVSAPCPTPGTPSSPSPADDAAAVTTSPTLSWTASSDADSYDIYFGTSFPPPLVGNTTDTSFPRSGLIPNTIYYWKVVARNTCGNSSPGPVWSFTTSGISPREGTLGTVIAIAGSGFGIAKGKVLLDFTALKVLDWNGGMIHALVKQALPEIVYDVTVLPKAKGSLPIIEGEAFEIKGPRIDHLSRNSGFPGEEITIFGNFFSTKKGKVYLGGKSCKVSNWTMDPLNGTGQITFLVPKGLIPDTYEILVTNRIGYDSMGGFKVE